MAFMDDGFIGPGGKPILFGEEGAVQLNKDDSMIVGTNLGGGGSGGGQEDKRIVRLIKRELKAQNDILRQILAKDTNVYLDGNKLGTSLALSNPEIQ